jgi:hypothetical protein
MSTKITQKTFENEMVDIKTILLCAKLSSLAYSGETENELVDEKVVVIEKDNAKCLISNHSEKMYIAIAGTDDPFDVLSDFEFQHVIDESTNERVHMGFKNEADKLFQKINEEILKQNVKQLVLTGHSLGGAICIIIAARFQKLMPELVCRLITFGSPRVGTKSFVKQIKYQHTRVVCSRDPITHLPPNLFGFKHHGTLMTLKPNTFLSIKQHSINTYINALKEISASSEINSEKNEKQQHSVLNCFH